MGGLRPKPVVSRAVSPNTHLSSPPNRCSCMVCDILHPLLHERRHARRQVALQFLPALMTRAALQFLPALMTRAALSATRPALERARSCPQLAHGPGACKRSSLLPLSLSPPPTSLPLLRGMRDEG